MMTRNQTITFDDVEIKFLQEFLHASTNQDDLDKNPPSTYPISAKGNYNETSDQTELAEYNGKKTDNLKCQTISRKHKEENASIANTIDGWRPEDYSGSDIDVKTWNEAIWHKTKIASHQERLEE